MDNGEPVPAFGPYASSYAGLVCFLRKENVHHIEMKGTVIVANWGTSGMTKLLFTLPLEYIPVTRFRQAIVAIDGLGGEFSAWLYVETDGQVNVSIGGNGLSTWPTAITGILGATVAINYLIPID